MKTLIIYYSFTGNTRRLVSRLKEEHNADLVEVFEEGNRSKAGAFTGGVMKSRKMKPAKLQPVKVDFSLYDRIIVAAPIWGGYPAPAFNSIIDMIPEGSKIEILLTSSSGKVQKGEGEVKARIVSKGIEIVSLQNIKTKKKDNIE